MTGSVGFRFENILTKVFKVNSILDPKKMITVQFIKKKQQQTIKYRENNDNEKKSLTLELPIQLKVQSWMKNCPSSPPPSLAQQMSEQERGLDTN